MGRRKSWREKLYDAQGLPKVTPLEGKLRAKWGPGTLLVPSPVEILEIMQQVPPGRVITQEEIRQVLARRHGATLTCPLTTGIFVNIVAWASEEERLESGTLLAPYWRTLKRNGALNPRFPGGQERHRHLLEREGLTVAPRRKTWRVADWQQHLWVPEA